MATVEIIPERPFDDGEDAGRQLGRQGIAERTEALLREPGLRETLGAMSRSALADMVTGRLEAQPDYGRYPELAELYPERVDYLRGFAQGAGCSPAEAAVYDYLRYRDEIESWHRAYQVELEPSHCSGIFLNGPDGVLGAHSMESLPLEPMPTGYRLRRPRPAGTVRSRRPARPALSLTRPRTGYIQGWGVTNEKGLGCFAAVSCGVLLDEPIEDTWPIGKVPLLRFAASVAELATLYRRYSLFNWGRASLLFADIGGNAMVVEKSFRRIGIRMSGDASVLWCTEGHFETPEMGAYLRAKRLEFLEKTGGHLGAGDMQYAADCAVRFTHIGALCHEPWGHGYEHMRRILTDHAPFPRAVCRHCGPDTAPYDRTITQASIFRDATHNRAFTRRWVPWQRFCCQVPEEVMHYPPVPG